MAVVGPPVLLLALLFRKLPWLFAAGRGGIHLGLFLSGVTLRVEGAEHLQRQRASIYAVNHASNVEPPLLFEALSPLFPRLSVLYKAELRKLPILVRAFDLAGFVPLERGPIRDSRDFRSEVSRDFRSEVSVVAMPVELGPQGVRRVLEPALTRQERTLLENAFEM